MSNLFYVFFFSAKLYNTWTTERFPDGETYLGFNKTFKYIVVQEWLSVKFTDHNTTSTFIV